MLLLAIALLVRSLRKRKENKSVRTSGSANRKKLLGTVFALLSFAFAFPHLGFLLTTIPLMIFLSRAVGELNWKISLTIGLTTSFFMFLLFKVWLKVQFPTGPWGF